MKSDFFFLKKLASQQWSCKEIKERLEEVLMIKRGCKKVIYVLELIGKVLYLLGWTTPQNTCPNPPRVQLDPEESI